MERQNSRFDSHLERAKKASRFVFEHLPVAPFSSHGEHTFNRQADYIPFEDDIEVLPSKTDDSYLWYDMQGYPHGTDE
jgi:hypothetical protein